MDHSLVTVTIAILVDNDGFVSVTVGRALFLFNDSLIAIAVDLYAGGTNPDSYFVSCCRHYVASACNG